MKRRIFSVLKYLVSLGIGVLLIWYVFRGVDLSEMFSRVNSVKYGWIYLSIGLSLVSHWLRGYRWGLLLNAIGYRVSGFRLFIAVMVGYLANLAFPRMGEVARCGVLKNTDGVNISSSVGTVVAERIVDLITLITIIGITLLLEYDLLGGFLYDLFLSKQPGRLSSGIWIFVGVGVLFLILAVLGFVFRDTISKSHLFTKVKTFLRELMNGLLSIRRLRNPWLFVASSIGIWVLYYFMSYLIVFSIEETAGLKWTAGLSLLVTGGLAMSAPVQGGIGTYHFLVSNMLLLYGIAQEDGIFFATLLHTSQTVSVLFFGGISLIVSFLLTKKRNQNSE